MKNIVCLLAMLFVAVSCGENNRFAVKGVYESASDNTVMYMSRYMVSGIDDILVSFDSAVVRNGKFEFNGVCAQPQVCFVSSSMVVDGNYIVLEPGTVDFDMAERSVRGGTELNDKMERFLKEKERVIALRGMCAPGVLEAIAPAKEMRDSLIMIADLAGKVFDLYVMKNFEENATNVLGHFMLTQSVGVASPDVLDALFASVPESMRDKMYEIKEKQVKAALEQKKQTAQYVVNAEASAMETAVGKKYIDFELNNVLGEKVLFSNEVKSCDYIVMLFWGSWNESAIVFLKDVESLRSKYDKRKLGLVTISLDSSVDKCLEAVSVKDNSVVHLCNPAGGSAEVASGYGVVGVPYALLINRNGTILLRTSSMKDIESKLKEIL